MLARVQVKGTLVHCRWECKLVQPLRKTLWRVLKKLKIELPYDPAIPLLSNYPKKMKILTWKDICPPMFIATLFTMAKIWEQHKPQQQINGERKCDKCSHTHTHMHTHNGILFSHKKHEILSFAITWMNLKGITLSEISQSKTNTV